MMKGIRNLLKRIHHVEAEAPPLVCLVCHAGICINCSSCCGASPCAEVCGAFIFKNKTTLRKAAQQEGLEGTLDAYKRGFREAPCRK